MKYILVHTLIYKTGYIYLGLAPGNIRLVISGRCYQHLYMKRIYIGVNLKADIHTYTSYMDTHIEITGTGCRQVGPAKIKSVLRRGGPDRHTSFK